MNTPWEESQTVKRLAPGVLVVSTAGHGGLMLKAEAFQTLPAHIQKAGMRFGEYLCYEEDCAYGLVMEFRPDLYRADRQQSLDSWKATMARDYIPDWAAKEGPECIAKIEAELAKSDAELIAPIAESNRYWFPELFGLPRRR
jgi:hypothetical protein